MLFLSRSVRVCLWYVRWGGWGRVASFTLINKYVQSCNTEGTSTVILVPGFGFIQRQSLLAASPCWLPVKKGNMSNCLVRMFGLYCRVTSNFDFLNQNRAHYQAYFLVESNFYTVNRNDSIPESVNFARLLRWMRSCQIGSVLPVICLISCIYSNVRETIMKFWQKCSLLF